MGREILITGEEILYRDVIAGQPKPDWQKGPSINLTVLQTPSSTTRMQVSGNQYMQLSALQSFFAQAFADIDHEHDDRYDAAGTAASVVSIHAANHAPANAQANVIEVFKINGNVVPITDKELNIITDSTITGSGTVSDPFRLSQDIIDNINAAL